MATGLGTTDSAWQVRWITTLRAHSAFSSQVLTSSSCSAGGSGTAIISAASAASSLAS